MSNYYSISDVLLFGIPNNYKSTSTNAMPFCFHGGVSTTLTFAIHADASEMEIKKRNKHFLSAY